MADPIQGKPISSLNLTGGVPQAATNTFKQTSIKPIPPPQPPKQVTRTDLAELQGKAANTISPSKPQENEAVSFLKVPFSGQKAAGTKMVPSTTLLDPLQFSGVGAGTKAAIKGGSSLVDVLKSQAKPASKIGTKDIGLNIQASKTFESSQRFERQTRTLPKPNTISAPYSPPSKPIKTTSVSAGFTGTNVNLGRGIGTMTKSGGKGGITNDLFKSPPSPPHPPKPTQGKEISAGKGLIQLVKEKPVTQKQESTFKQYPISLGKTTLKTVPKQVQVTKAEQATKDYLKSLQTLTLKRQTKQQQTSGFMFLPIQKQQSKQSFIQPQKQKQKQVPILPVIPRQTFKQVPIQRQPPLQKQPPAQKQPPLLKVPPLLFTPPKIPNTPPKIPNNPIVPPKIPREPPTTKKKIGDVFPFSLNPLNGGGGGGFGEGDTKAFVGNVPEYQFTGMFNRIETKYGKGGSIPRGYKLSKQEVKSSKSFSVFSKASGQTKKSSGKQSKPLSNKFNRLI